MSLLKEPLEIRKPLTHTGHLSSSSSNSNARQQTPPALFSLTSLPPELLEHTALFFTQAEAARVLTVSQAFHDAFARSLWYTLFSWNLSRAGNKWRYANSMAFVPLESLVRYGHLVRRLIIENDSLALSDFAEWMPNVYIVNVNSYFAAYLLGPDQLCQLRNVHLIKITSVDLNPKDFDRVLGWLENDEASGQMKHIRLALCGPSKWPNRINRLLNVMSKDRNISRKRIGLEVYYDGQEIETQPHVIEMATNLVFFSVGGSFNKRCTGLSLRNLLSNSGAFFPFVSKLTVTVCCVGEMSFDFSALTPDNFPMVRTLQLIPATAECDAPSTDESILTHAFKQPWLNVTCLCVSGKVFQSDHDVIASGLPNLAELDYSSRIGTFNLVSLLPKYRGLQRLNLRDYYSKTSGQERFAAYAFPSSGLDRLWSVSFTHAIINAEIVRFIFGSCPGLREIAFKGCVLTDNLAPVALEASSLSTSFGVRRIVYGSGLGIRGAMDVDAWLEFTAAFRKLQTIFIEQSKQCNILYEQFTKHFPYISVQLEI